MVRFPDPDHTRKCRYCDLSLVLGEAGDGRRSWVHCGTWRAGCPQPLPRAMETATGAAPPAAHSLPGGVTSSGRSSTARTLMPAGRS